VVTDAGNAERIRRICLGFPEVTERLSHGTPAYFVRDKRAFVTAWPDGHHGAHFPQLWCAAPPGAQATAIEAEPGRFFRPPYVGHRGWLGVRLDEDLDWSEIAEICADAYRAVAPATLVARLVGDDATRPRHHDEEVSGSDPRANEAAR
jgi:hypothetical protein